jgi:hypothetical protein
LNMESLKDQQRRDAITATSAVTGTLRPLSCHVDILKRTRVIG